MPSPIWTPDPQAAAETNVGRFQAVHGIATFDELLARSIDDPAWFWGAVVEFLGLPFPVAYDHVLDTSKGVPWATWFTGGRTNLATMCLDRWVEESPESEAVRWEGEDGEVRVLTYAELARHVDGLASLLRARGVGLGDAVGIFLPMLPETVVAALAVAKLGAMFLPVFSGYGAEAIAVRLEDAGAKALLCADGFYRRGGVVPMLATAQEAVSQVDTVETIVVVPRVGDVAESEVDGVTTLPWPGPTDEVVETELVDSEHPLFIAYTSGTTGKPKGSVHVHGGFTVKIAEEVAFQFDCRPGDRLFWFADFGWIMG
ncbi:MAG: AMP-binding protein, partial [Acidimicrobiales bacterium]|nr:AMP-binding protein [Acidimicrobiales bacterium]